MMLLFASIWKFLDTAGNNAEIERRSWNDKIMEQRNVGLEV
jgi:hypothetical protein